MLKKTGAHLSMSAGFIVADSSSRDHVYGIIINSQPRNVITTLNPGRNAHLDEATCGKSFKDVTPRLACGEFGTNHQIDHDMICLDII